MQKQKKWEVTVVQKPIFEYSQYHVPVLFPICQFSTTMCYKLSLSQKKKKKKNTIIKKNEKKSPSDTCLTTFPWCFFITLCRCPSCWSGKFSLSSGLLSCSAYLWPSSEFWSPIQCSGSCWEPATPSSIHPTTSMPWDEHKSKTNTHLIWCF